MSKMVRLTVALLSAAGLVAVVVALNAGGAGARAPHQHPAASAWRTKTLHYRFATEKCQHSSVGSDPDYNFGDRYVCGYDVMSHGKKIGHAGFDCGLISPEEGICGGTFDLPGGTIATIGRQIDGKAIPLSGGTGRYLGASGDWQYGTTSPRFTLRLLLPNAA